MNGGKGQDSKASAATRGYIASRRLLVDRLQASATVALGQPALPAVGPLAREGQCEVGS